MYRPRLNLTFNKDTEHIYDELQRLSDISGVPMARLGREYLANGMKTQIEQPRPLLIQR